MSLINRALKAMTNQDDKPSPKQDTQAKQDAAFAKAVELLQAQDLPITPEEERIADMLDADS